jgi:hypothetical protein
MTYGIVILTYEIVILSGAKDLLFARAGDPDGTQFMLRTYETPH